MNYLAIALCLLAFVKSTRAGENISCNFEDDACDWQIEHDEDGPWRRARHSQEMKEPFYPDSSDYFMNMLCHTRIGRCHGRLASSDVFWNTSSSHVRISFWFLIQSPSNLSPTSSLSLGFQETNRSVHWVFHSHQAVANCFGHWTFVTLCTIAVEEDMQLLFEATAQRFDSIGLDDISSEIVDHCVDTAPNILCVTRPTPTPEIKPEKFIESVVESEKKPRRRQSSSTTSLHTNKLTWCYQISVLSTLLFLGSVLR